VWTSKQDVHNIAYATGIIWQQNLCSQLHNKNNAGQWTYPQSRSTLFLHGVCMLRECIYGECAHEQHLRRTLTLTHTITAVLSKWKSRIYVCAYSCVQLDKSRVEQEFTHRAPVLHPRMHFRHLSKTKTASHCNR